MSRTELANVIAVLAVQRPVFHSEADFQHGLAWQLHTEAPAAPVRLEYRPLADRRMYLDIWMVTSEETLAIEVKYPTRATVLHVNDEKYELQNQAAHDSHHYDFWKDLARLEEVVQAYVSDHAVRGYAVLLTNDSVYWKPPRKPDVADAAFRIHEGRTVSHETLSWSSRAAPGTTKDREQPVSVRGDYRMTWQDFSWPSRDRHGRFRFLMIEVSPSALT